MQRSRRKIPDSTGISIHGDPLNRVGFGITTTVWRSAYRQGANLLTLSSQ